MKYNHYRLSLFVLLRFMGLLFAFVAVSTIAYANRDSLVLARKVVTTALNSAIAMHKDSVVLPHTVAFLNKNGVCDTLDTLPVHIDYNYTDSTFSISVMRRDAYNAVIPS